MKKIILSTILVVLISTLQLFSQNFTLHSPVHGEISNGDIIDVYASPYTTNELAEKINVINTSSEGINVLVKFEVMNQIEGTTNQFCWGVNCYPPNTEVSGIELIEPNEEQEFSSHYIMMNDITPIYGTSSFKYTFEERTAGSTPIEITINFIVEPNFEQRAILLFDKDDNPIENDGVLTVNDDLDNPILVSHVKVKNNLNDSIKVLVRRVRVTITSPAIDYFCWGACFAPSTDLSTIALPIAPGEVSNDFSGDYQHNSVTDEAHIRYEFFLEDNLYNMTSVNVKYKAGNDGINEFNNVFENLKAYPIPANQFLNIDYTLKNDKTNARFDIVNILGETVFSHPLNAFNNQLRINTSSYENGVYFYRIIIENQTAVSKKFIVTH